MCQAFDQPAQNLSLPRTDINRRVKVLLPISLRCQVRGGDRVREKYRMPGNSNAQIGRDIGQKIIPIQIAGDPSLRNQQEFVVLIVVTNHEEP